MSTVHWKNVPVHHADRLGKWIGPDDADPILNRLGERTWTQAKAAAQRAADELAQELLDLYATRETIPGHAFPADTDWQAELEAAFPYHETEDQLRVIGEVKDDMERANPMDRLICGDVGYGKTEVALRAAFKAVMDGKQVAMLVPTTILAQQHYTTFRERLTSFPVTVEMLSRFRTPTRQRQIVQKLREGQIDIVIGTHRMLSLEVLAEYVEQYQPPDTLFTCTARIDELGYEEFVSQHGDRFCPWCYYCVCNLVIYTGTKENDSFF